MIPKLRKKFISITAAALFAMIFLVVGSINCIFIIQNIRLLSTNLDQLLQMYGDMPGAPEMDGSSPKLPGKFSQGTGGGPWMGDMAGEPGLRHGGPDAAFADNIPGDTPPGAFRLLPRFEDGLRVRTDGCLIFLNEDGSIADIRQDAAENYSPEELAEIVSSIISRQKTEGWHQYYRYRLTTRQTSGGKTLTVVGLVNASSTLYAVFTMLTVSAVIGALSFFLVLLIIVFASGRAVRPIAESYTKQKQFVTDAGHELKTPLTVISANNELARMIYGDSEWFDSIDKQVEKMNGLVRSLITLAKMDEEQKPVFASFHLSDAVYDTAKSFENLIHAGGRVLTLDIADDIIYQGDESKLRQVISILMDNAVKYCSEQGKIAVRLVADKSVRLQITNDCALSEGFDPEKVFERFYRADKARTPDGSYGLGLSIAKSITDLHNGEIRAKVLEHNRIQFEVVLPKNK